MSFRRFTLGNSSTISRETPLDAIILKGMIYLLVLCLVCRWILRSVICAFAQHPLIHRPIESLKAILQKRIHTYWIVIVSRSCSLDQRVLKKGIVVWHVLWVLCGVSNNPELYNRGCVSLCDPGDHVLWRWWVLCLVARAPLIPVTTPEF